MSGLRLNLGCGMNQMCGFVNVDKFGEPDVRLLTPRQVERAAGEGALVVDVRTDLQFDEAHVPGALCITMLRAGFGSKLAWLADPDGVVVLVGRDDDDARRAAQLAASVGVTHIAGALHGGMTSWREERRPVQRIERITVSEHFMLVESIPERRVLPRAPKPELAS